MAQHVYPTDHNTKHLIVQVPMYLIMQSIVTKLPIIRPLCDNRKSKQPLLTLGVKSIAHSNRQLGFVQGLKLPTADTNVNG